MKFKPNTDEAQKRKPFTVNLLPGDIELIKEWSNQLYMSPAKLAQQMVEHALRENRAEIMRDSGYVIDLKGERK